ncbi:MAG: HEPN domain protein [candidate division WS6 bacterium OLB20]|uniref:HEPN domain protein n=1 Tax=candidate division WS6 bacterium OLB20 TaxID=1617426 RepID=A0A136LW21_9BACT|nr:MAG: HEPN domain protein [candidate division WS6 bacterium OLB20]
MREQLIPLKNRQSSERYKVWLKQAHYDLKAAEFSLEHGFNEWAAYQSEQAVEKALKAVIIHGGWRAPRIHKLQVLIGLANEVNDEFRNTRLEFRHLESFTFISRYPFLLPDKEGTPHEIIRKADAAKALGQAQTLIDQINIILKHDPQPTTEVAHPVSEMYTQARVEERLVEVKENLVREFDPERIILFGRFARTMEPKQPSTLDILIIAETEEPFIERIKRARKATKGGVPVVEPLIYTPEEFTLMTEQKEETFLESAVEEGKVLYERSAEPTQS